jgi:hypothetical protein
MYSLNLYDSAIHGGASLGNVTQRMLNWRRAIRRVGGFWIGTADYDGSLAERKSFFLNSLLYEIQEVTGPVVTWEGFVAEMEFEDERGETWVRSILPCANAIKGIYSKIGNNLFTNGSAESSVWGAVGTPSTRERVTTWRTHGTYGMHVVTDAADEGVEIGNSMAIVAGKAYQCQVTVEVESGTWSLVIYRSDTSDELASTTSSGTGDDVLQCRISEDNTYAGNTHVRLVADGSGAEIYADAGVYQLSPTRAETKWYEDSMSITELGRIEDVLLEAGRTDAGMAADCQTSLNRRAWPRTETPSRLGAMQKVVGLSRRRGGRGTGLSITFQGYVHTLNWRHTTSGGTDSASTQISTLVGESEFVTSGYIKTNSVDWQIEVRSPVGLWDEIEDIVEAGDGSGNRWGGGVYASRKFDYQTQDSEIKYHYRGGRLFEVNGSLVKPTKARPGLVRMDDMPVGPSQISGRDEDDPRVAFIDEIEFIAPNEIILHRER